MGSAFMGMDVPDHIYRSLCQNPLCRAPVGAFHFVCRGQVIFICHKCGGVSQFQNDEMNYKARFLGISKEYAPKSK